MIDFFMCRSCNASGFSYEVADKWHVRCKECEEDTHKKKIDLSTEDQILGFREAHKSIQEVNELEFYKRDIFNTWEGINTFTINTTDDGAFIV